MTQRIYHGNIDPSLLADSIIAHFDRGNYTTQKIGSDDQVIVQITTDNYRTSGGQTALSVTLRRVTDGVSVDIGKQAWLGVAASLGTTALQAIRNPFALINRLDDLAQDIESLQLSEEVLDAIEKSAAALNMGFQLSEKLKRLVCEYCDTANPTGASRCIACGAPLGQIQPTTCRHCGYIVTTRETVCPNCGKRLY